MKMKTLAILAGFVGMAAISTATATNCADPAVVPVLADFVDPAPGTPGSLSFTCGGITFSNFNAVSAAGAVTGLEVDLQSATFDSSTGRVLLTFDPNMFTTGPVEDIYFYFQAAGPIVTLDLTNGGTGNTSIQERGCSTPIDTGAANICTGGNANLLGQTDLVASGGSATVFAYSSVVVNPVYVFKDITVGGDGKAAHISAFSQSFTISAVPEPMTLSLMGVGLLGLGLLRKRIR